MKDFFKSYSLAAFVAALFLITACSQGAGGDSSPAANGSDTIAGTAVPDAVSGNTGATQPNAEGTTTGTANSSGTQPQAPAVTWTVSYDGNGQSSGSAPASQTVTDGTAATVAANGGSLAKTGYAFSGWNTKPDGTGTAYAAGIAAITPTADIALYARWLSTAPVAAQGWIQYPQNLTIAASTSFPIDVFARYYRPSGNSRIYLIIGTGNDPATWLEIPASYFKDVDNNKEYRAQIAAGDLGTLPAGQYYYTFKIREPASIWFYVSRYSGCAISASLPALEDLDVLTITR